MNVVLLFLMFLFARKAQMEALQRYCSRIFISASSRNKGENPKPSKKTCLKNIWDGIWQVSSCYDVNFKSQQRLYCAEGKKGLLERGSFLIQMRSRTTTGLLSDGAGYQSVLLLQTIPSTSGENDAGLQYDISIHQLDLLCICRK